MNETDVETLLRVMAGWTRERREDAIAGLVRFQMAAVERNRWDVWIGVVQKITGYFRPLMGDPPSPKVRAG